jgi:hypothetical protein
MVINSCDNQEYIAHPTKGECDDKKEEKAHPHTQRKNMMIKGIKPTPRVSSYFSTSNHLAKLPHENKRERKRLFLIHTSQKT